MRLGDRECSDDAPTLVIAEAGVNHDGDPEVAHALVAAAAEAGADVVKFQAFRAEDLVAADAPRAAYQERNDPEGGATQAAMLARLELDAAVFAALAGTCRDLGILFMATPFDASSAAMLVALDVPAIKVSSGDLTHLPFLAELAGFRRPLLVSTGMATMAEVDEAVATIRDAGDPPLALLHCVSDYPARVADANLRAIPALRARFGVPVGWSDHTEGVETALAAVALGARIVEKHLTLDRRRAGPDHAASLEPDAFAAMVRGIRAVESALGDGVKAPRPAEAAIARVARRSIVTARPVAAGERLDAEAIAFRRPGTGLPPGLSAEVIGRVARTDLPAGAVIAPEHLA